MECSLRTSCCQYAKSSPVAGCRVSGFGRHSAEFFPQMFWLLQTACSCSALFIHPSAAESHTGTVQPDKPLRRLNLLHLETNESCSLRGRRPRDLHTAPQGPRQNQSSRSGRRGAGGGITTDESGRSENDAVSRVCGEGEGSSDTSPG